MKHREVRLSLLSLIGQLLIISLVSATLVYKNVSSGRATGLILVLLAFIAIVLITIRRLFILEKNISSGWV
ncbi:hypothetical protein [uncultured Methanolobus sp.]|uniref:hypothetical protein n=1 Tax=uncultured Methanolobus sp. TaxID=218300 RepID=UPI003748FB1F